MNYDRILKVARTIVDLEGCADVLTHHNRDAHQPYRNLNWLSDLGSCL